MSVRVASANVRVTLDHLQAATVLQQVLDLNPDFGGLQEWPKGRDQLLKAATAYDHARNDLGGGPVFWRRDRYGLVRCRAIKLSRRSFVGKLAGRKSTLPANHATLAILCDDTDDSETAVINAHLDAEVQYAGHYRTDLAHRPRVRRHKKQVRRLVRAARRQRRRGRKVVVMLDGNFDGLELDGLTSCWDAPDLPVGGTLGNRRVDIVFAATAPKRVRTIKTASDHRAVVADY